MREDQGLARSPCGEIFQTMNDDQQSAGVTGGEDNVMERVLGSLDGLYDNATSLISGAAASVGDITRDLTADLGDGTVGDIAGDAGDVASSIGETATGVAISVGAAVGDKLDAAVTFAKGLFGG